MLIRDVTVQDAPVVAGLVGALLSELGGQTDATQLAAVATSLLGTAEVTGSLAFAPEGTDPDVPVAVIMLNQCAAIYAGGLFGEITELYVRPEYRARGVAARLIEAAAATGRARGWARLEVGAPPQPAWQRTLAFYQRNGFLETGPRLRRLLSS